MNKKEGLSKRSLAIYNALKENPEGLDIFQLRKLLLREDEPQQHFDKRLRELYPHYVIHRRREKNRTIYKLIGPRAEGEWVHGKVSKTLRAEILNRASGKCQMCGSTILEDGVRLHIDHKIPESWGGKTETDNLWAICSVCNEGKKNYFATFDKKLMAEITRHSSVHRRILELLRLKKEEWVDRDLIEFVAYALGQQEDWQKRLRELRYFGLIIENQKVKRGRRIISQYRLINWIENLPSDLSQAAHEYERKRAEKNKQLL